MSYEEADRLTPDSEEIFLFWPTPVVRELTKAERLEIEKELEKTFVFTRLTEEELAVIGEEELEKINRRNFDIACALNSAIRTEEKVRSWKYAYEEWEMRVMAQRQEDWGFRD